MCAHTAALTLQRPHGSKAPHRAPQQPFHVSERLLVTRHESPEWQQKVKDGRVLDHDAGEEHGCDRASTQPWSNRRG
jgi:hypothetical protein